jgi:Ni/Co efflux regulator RcnB
MLQYPIGRFMTGLALVILSVGLLPAALQAQDDDNPRNEERIFDPNIRSVQMLVGGSILALPIVELNGGAGLALEFDHLGTDLKNYSYTLRHCNSDWQPSILQDNEYLGVFTEDIIFDFYNSSGTLHQYVHYSLKLPNANVRWTVSGNYLLNIYDNDDDHRLVMVRRFMVVESRWSINAQLVRTISALKSNTHHEMDFTVSHKKTLVSYPEREVKAYILQNGRWDIAEGPILPQLSRQEQLVFDYLDSIVFPAGKEWRLFDMRTFDQRGQYIKSIFPKPDRYIVTLKPDVDRSVRPYVFYPDLDGRFLIGNTTLNQTIEQCDYAEVIFWMPREMPYIDKEVYVFGALTDWQIKSEFKMKYDESIKAYVAQPFLKQGYYNYQYVVVDSETGRIDEEGFEGNSYETINTYTVLVYYRPFGERYERLMAVNSLNSTGLRR